MNFLFWNVRRKPLYDLISSLASEYSVDVLVLAEWVSDEMILLERLNVDRSSKYGLALDYLPDQRIRIFSTLPRNAFVPLRDEGNATLRLLRPPVGEEIILVGVHLSSKMFQSEMDQAFNASRLSSLIREVETEVGHEKTVVIGDLNMNPFEPGMTGAEAFHAVMTKKVAARTSRVVSGESRPFFYNPMWGRLGDGSEGPAGTYYYGGGNQLNYFWNMFDQVLLRPSLIPFFKSESLRIISEVGGESLLRKNGQPNSTFASDHLPVFFQLLI